MDFWTFAKRELMTFFMTGWPFLVLSICLFLDFSLSFWLFALCLSISSFVLASASAAFAA